MTERLIISAPFYIRESNTECGYCHGKKPIEQDYSLQSWSQFLQEDGDNIAFENATLGFQAESLSVEMYDKLCNIGFRRSGKFLYKTDMLRNCCRLYTIRTTSKQVRFSKELKTSVKRYKKSIRDDDVQDQKLSNSNNTTNREVDYFKEMIEGERNSNCFKCVFEPAVFTKEKYDLFVKYQENVHKDHINSEKSFKRFLCDSPFSEETIIGTQEEWDELNNWKDFKKNDRLKRLGPAHECYYYKNNLIAVAVVDILPSGISSVYFIWDPDYHKWSLGKLSALRELCITERLNLGYYYMGYYIEDCPKMAYKAKYGGELLDICRHEYIPIEKLKENVNLEKLFTFQNESSEVFSEQHLNDKLKGPPTLMDSKSNARNTADSVYGPEGTALINANAAARKLSDLGIPYEVTQDRSIYGNHSETSTAKDYRNFPNVFPGLVPLPEILEMVEKGKLNMLNYGLLFYDTKLGNIRPMSNFEKESSHIKKLVCDIVRCIGLHNTIDALIII